MADGDARSFFVRAEHPGFGWEYGRAVRLHGDEPNQRALVVFGDHSRCWCERWEIIERPIRPFDLTAEAIDLVTMIPDDAGSDRAGGGAGLLKREALAALERLRRWFD